MHLGHCRCWQKDCQRRRLQKKTLWQKRPSQSGVGLWRRLSQSRISFVCGPLTEITQPCVHTCDGLFICQLYLLPNILEETDCKEDTPLTLPFCIIRFPLTVDNSDMN
jgi:hypothetical protein